MIIFVGRSNVGKSTLIYQLTGKRVKSGKRPGVTRRPVEVTWRNRKIVDMPGFGFMSGLPKHVQEKIKDGIVRFIEENADDIELAVLVIDGKAAPEIIERWERRGEIPIDVEFFHFLRELDISVIVALNKIDRVKNVERVMTFLAEKFGIGYGEAGEIIIPVSSKFGSNLDALKRAIEDGLGRKNAKKPRGQRGLSYP